MCRILSEIVWVISKKDKLTLQIRQDILGCQSFRNLREVILVKTKKPRLTYNLTRFFIVHI